MGELERQLLGKLTDPQNVARAHSLGVRSAHFEEPICSAVWQFIVDYWESSGADAAPTAWAIENEFPGFTVTPGGDTVEYLAEKLRSRYATNQLQEMIMEVVGQTNSDPLGALRTLHERSSRATEAVIKRQTRVNMADNIEERRAEYDQRETLEGQIGVLYGLGLVDAQTGGLMPGELAVVGAVSKTGKSMFLFHVAAQVAKQGHKVIVFTLEMSIQEVQLRLDAMFSGVSYDGLLNGRLSESERAQLCAAQDELKQLGGIQIEMPEEGDRTVSAILSRARQYGATYLIIDQLSHMEAGHKVSSLKEHHASIMKSLSVGISVPGSEIPCLIAAQMRRGDDELTQESFANAAEIEREADIMFGLSRNQDLRNNHAMRLDILGSRRSDNGSFLLGWELQSKTEIVTLDRVRG